MFRSMMFLSVLLMVWGCEPGGASLDPVYDDDDAGDDDTGDDDTGDDDTESGGVTLTPALDFGDVGVGCTSELLMDVVNGSDESVTVTGGATDPAGDYYVTIDGGWDQALAPGGSATLHVQFDPQTLGEQPATIEVTTSHSDYPALNQPVTGVGISGGSTSDQFVQTVNHKKDILWVVDNSCSMMDEQSSLAANVTDFLDHFSSWNVDFHMGVVTTDNGALQGYGVMDPTTPDLASELASAFLVGTDGGGMEMPLQYGYDAVTSPLIDPGGSNEGFVRADAGLALIVVTDEDDASGGTAADWISDLQALKADPSWVTVSGLTGGVSGCAGATAAPILADVIAGTNGDDISICDADWLPVLTMAGVPVLSWSDTFELNSTAIEGTIEVLLDGIPLTSGWYFDPIINAVVFEQDYIPAEDVVIDINYEVSAC